MLVAEDLGFLWATVSRLREPLFRHRELERYERDLWEPLIENGLLRETPIPKRYVDEKNRWIIVRQVNRKLFGVEYSDEPNRFEVLSEDDVRQYYFSPSAFAEALRGADAIAGKGQSESEGFLRLGDKRITAKDTLRVYLSVGAAHLDSIELRLRALARERSRSARVVVFPVYPDLDSATEELLEASNLFVTDIDTASFEINWPLSLGPKPSKPQYALLNEGATWQLIFEGKETTVPDSKGIRYLANLLANPGKCYTAFELAHPVAILERLDQSDLEATDSHSLIEYRRRLQRVDEDLEESRASERRHLSEASRIRTASVADKWIRRGLVAAIVFAVILAPFIVTVFTDAATVLQYTEQTGGKLFGLLGPSKEAVRFESVDGLLVTPETRQALLAVVAFYFGQGAAK